MLFMSFQAYSQEGKEYTLEQLQTLARENYPLLKQKQMYTDIGNNKIKQVGTNFLPQINIAGQATYQSEVTEFAFPGLYLNSFSVIRQYFSLAISFYAFYFLINKKYVTYLLLMFIGVSMHNTCFIPFFVFLGVYQWGNKIKAIHIALALIVSLVFSQIHFLESVGVFFEKTRYSYYFSTHRNPTNQLKLIVLNAVAFFVLFHFEKMKEKYPLQQYLMPLYFCSVIITNLFAIYIDLTRIAYYFKIFEIIVIADLIFLGTKEKSLKYLTFFYVYYLSIFMYALWTDLNDKCQFANYKSILF